LVENAAIVSPSANAEVAATPLPATAHSLAIDSALSAGFLTSTSATIQSRSAFSHRASVSADSGSADLLLMLRPTNDAQTSFEFADDTGDSWSAVPNNAVDVHFAEFGAEGLVEDRAEFIVL
jgi:hypothetical protein